MSKFTSLLPLIFAVAGISGCCHHCDECRECAPDAALAPTTTHTESVAAKTAPPAPTSNVPDIAGKWTGKWTAGTHGGGLNCETKATGPNKWEALFIAEFGIIGRYTVKLDGKPGNGEVLFGGKVDLGIGDAGIFNWTGKADAAEFTGQFEGGGEKGTFKMTRVK